MFGENKASTFNRNLEKMIALVLFGKYNDGLTVTDIISDIKEKYALDFSDSEIIDTIEHRHQHRIIQVNEERDEALKKYSITPEEYEHINKKTDDSSIKEIVSLFLKSHEDIDFTDDAFTELLVKYLYDVFNSNAETILALMNGDNSRIKPTNYEYSQDEKEIINKFIYWSNSDKNKCVYQLISCCFDYCMMTVRRDKSVYSTIFNQKKFYLDTNIVFRLMGLNNASRKIVIDAFILKCKETGIQVLYSNHTKNEINDTITYYVTQIKNTLLDSAPISVQAMSCLNDRLSNSDFYAEYVEWTKKTINRACDYTSFADDLKRKASEILSQFKPVSFDDYAGRREKEYTEQFDSLKHYKIEHRRNIYDPSIKADVNNYLYIQDRNKDKKGEDFFSTDHYLITADHAFSGWEREKRPGTIPTVVLPSVWYAIILQYAGRTTEDDYSSFTRFLNFSFSDNEPTDPRKMEILKLVLGLNEPTVIKEKTIYDISEKLQHEYKDLNSEEIVEISHQYVVDQALAEANEKAQKEKEAAIELERQKAATHEEVLRTEYQSSMRSMSNKLDAEVNLLRAENIRIADQAEQDVKIAKAEERDRLVNKETEKRTNRRIKIYAFLTALLIIGFIVILILTGNWVLNVGEATDEVQMKYDYIKYALDAAYLILSGVIVAFVFKGFDKDKISKSIRENVEEEMS